MKLLISLVIEASANDIHEIKREILETASKAIVSCSIDTIPEPEKSYPWSATKKPCSPETVKACLSSLYGKFENDNINNGGH